MEVKKSKTLSVSCGTAILAVTLHGQDARATLGSASRFFDCKIERTNQECL